MSFIFEPLVNTYYAFINGTYGIIRVFLTDLINAPGQLVAILSESHLPARNWIYIDLIQCIIGFWLLIYLFFVIIAFPFALWFACEDLYIQHKYNLNYNIEDSED